MVAAAAQDRVGSPDEALPVLRGGDPGRRDRLPVLRTGGRARRAGRPLPRRSPAAAGAPRPAGEDEALQYTHSGRRYLLGYGPDFFGIWDRTTPATPVARYPRTDEGWRSAWLAFRADEPDAAEVGLSGARRPPSATDPRVLVGAPVGDAAPPARRVSGAWWLLPIFMGWLGGLIAWLVNRDLDPDKARVDADHRGSSSASVIVLVFVLASARPRRRRRRSARRCRRPPPRRGRARAPRSDRARRRTSRTYARPRSSTHSRSTAVDASVQTRHGDREHDPGERARDDRVAPVGGAARRAAAAEDGRAAPAPAGTGGTAAARRRTVDARDRQLGVAAGRIGVDGVEPTASGNRRVAQDVGVRRCPRPGTHPPIAGTTHPRRFGRRDREMVAEEQRRRPRADRATARRYLAVVGVVSAIGPSGSTTPPTNSPANDEGERATSIVRRAGDRDLDRAGATARPGDAGPGHADPVAPARAGQHREERAGTPRPAPGRASAGRRRVAAAVARTARVSTSTSGASAANGSGVPDRDHGRRRAARAARRRRAHRAAARPARTRSDAAATVTASSATPTVRSIRLAAGVTRSRISRRIGDVMDGAHLEPPEAERSHRARAPSRRTPRPGARAPRRCRGRGEREAPRADRDADARPATSPRPPARDAHPTAAWASSATSVGRASHPDADRLERLGLRRGGAARAGDDRAGVAHPLARRRLEARRCSRRRVCASCSAMYAAARSSSSPPISPTITTRSVSGSASNALERLDEPDPVDGVAAHPDARRLPETAPR